MHPTWESVATLPTVADSTLLSRAPSCGAMSKIIEHSLPEFFGEKGKGVGIN